MSQRTSQQKLSTSQTSSQQSASSQKGVTRGTQQLPVFESPQPGQKKAAHSTQVWSQVVWQQVGSTAQTSVQQAASSQPKPSWTTRQEPAPGAPQPWQTSAAFAAQSASHAITQQSPKPGSEQTYEQQLLSAQPGVPFAEKHEFALVPQGEQNFTAIATHSSSHATSQQKGSIEQVVWQHSGLAQPFLSSATSKQECVGSPQDAGTSPAYAGAPVKSAETIEAKRAVVRMERRRC
jgi:hypothetical protein